MSAFGACINRVVFYNMVLIKWTEALKNDIDVMQSYSLNFFFTDALAITQSTSQLIGTITLHVHAVFPLCDADYRTSP